MSKPMSDNYLPKIYHLAQKYKIPIVALLGIVILCSLFSMRFVRYSSNIETMLPIDKDVQRSMRFLRESNFSDKLIISLGLKDAQHSTGDLIAATDQFAASIKSPLVTQVIANVSSGNLMDEMVLFLKYTPQLLGEESFLKLNNQVNPIGIQKRLKFIYRQSLAPGSAFLVPFMRADPFGTASGIMRNIEKLSAASGYDVAMNNGHFISSDGRNSMVIVKTTVSLTEGSGSRKVVDYLKDSLKGVPNFISTNIIAGHLHTVSNEDMIKKDVQFTTIIAFLAFLLLLLFFLRDLRAIIVFLIPFAAVIISTSIAALVFKDLSYFVIGWSSVIAGIAIDYGIYTYFAVRKGGNSLQTIRQIISPVICGAATTISVFAAFFFSSMQGYHQLAFLSNLSIILCLVFSLFLLPHFFKKENSSSLSAQEAKPVRAYNLGIPDRVWVISWIGMIVVMFVLSVRLKFNNDITQFDGTSKEILKAEDNFHNVWGGKTLPAVFVVSAKDLTAAYDINDRVYRRAIKEVGENNFHSLAAVWPGLTQRRVNLSRWEDFWTKEKENEAKSLFAANGQVYNFSTDAFAQFFSGLHSGADLVIEPKGLTFFDHLKEQFVLKKADGYQIVSFFPDQEQYISKLSVLSNNYPGTFLVSRKSFSQQVARALSKELVFLFLIAIFATVLITFLLLKSMKLSVLAMVPVVTSLAVTSGVISLAGFSLNMPSMLSAMVVVGIVSDYGIFVTYYCKHKFETGTYLAVTFAAVTTLIGAGVLLFARHPVIFSVGLTLTSGVLSGYLSSLLIIPPLYRLLYAQEKAYKIRRCNLFEIADNPYFPVIFRDMMTDILQFAVVKFRVYEPVIPLIKELMQHMQTNRIIDLCSGGSGPWMQIEEQLQLQQEPVFITLTDKYPNIQAFKKIKERFGNKINYIPNEIDAMNVPADLKGIRTVFSSLHHFQPEGARKILQNAADSRSAIGVFEFTENHLGKLAFPALISIFVLFAAPFVRPISFRRLFWIYVIPVIPWVMAYDAIVSYLTTYSPEDLQELVKGIDAKGYAWKIKQVSSAMRHIRITYLIGIPHA